MRTIPCLAVALLVTPAAEAQDFPNRFVTIVSPFQAGGPSDTVARLIAGPMSKTLGQQVVVENVTGAGGTIGSARVAKANPDGYTLEISGSGTHAAVEQLYANPPYRALDFESVGLVNTTPVVVVGKRDLPPNTFQELIAYLRANQKTVTEADAGIGSVSQLSCSVLHALIGVKPTIVSYRGTPQATQDVLGGNVDFLCNQIVNIVEHVKSGQIKAYAVTGDTRSPMLPDVPTTAEAGLPDVRMETWFGLAGPPGLPKEIVARITKDLAVIVKQPAFQDRLAKLGMAVDYKPDAEFIAFLAAETRRWRELIPAMGIEQVD